MSNLIRRSDKSKVSFLYDVEWFAHAARRGSIQCSLSWHEMPYKEDVIRSYVKGRKYLKLVERDGKNYEKYKPHLVASTKKYHEHQLFCVLTMTHVNKTPVHVERHVNGAKYKRCLARWEDCQKTGKEYRPPRGRRKMQENPDMKKGVNSVEDGAQDDEGEISDADSLSDLYPAADLVRLDDSEENMEASGHTEKDEGNDSDFEFEDMEADNTDTVKDVQDNNSPNTHTENRGQKRNKIKGGRHQKQMKKKMQKIS